MSHESIFANVAKMNELQSVSTNSTPRSTPRRQNTNITPRRQLFKTPDNKFNKVTPRRRSLTMSDIRKGKPENARTPTKPMKIDSCSTSDYSPRISDSHPAEKMLRIRKRELKIHTFARMYFSLWRKHKSITDEFKKQLANLELQKSFLKELRDKESDRREEITQIAEELKTEKIELEEKLILLNEKCEHLEEYSTELFQEYNTSLNLLQKYSDDMDFIQKENGRILSKVNEMSFMLNSRHINLENILINIEELEYIAQEDVSEYIRMIYDRSELKRCIKNTVKESYILKAKYDDKLKNEKKLNNAIGTLKLKLTDACSENADLKCNIKNLNLQLEFIEQEIEDLKRQPKGWVYIVRGAVRYTMFSFFLVKTLTTY